MRPALETRDKWRCAAIAPLFAVACATPGCRDAAPTDASPDAGETALPPPTESPCGTATRPDPSSAWEVVCGEAGAGHFLGTWGSGPDDVYFVGGAPGQTAIWHWNGGRVSALDNPGQARAWWVFGIGQGRVWVVGEHGLMLTRTSTGAFQLVQTGIDDTIYGAWGPSSDELYFVTGSFTSSTSRGRLYRLGPLGVETVHALVLDDYEGQALFKVWGSGPDDLFVSGDRGAVFRRAGGVWSKVIAPTTRAPMLTVAGRPGGEVYAVGGRGRGVIWRFAGDHFAAISTSTIPGLMGVHVGRDEVLVSGEDGTLAALDANQLLHSEGALTEEPLHAVWQDEEGGAWSVGGNLFDIASPPTGVILRKQAFLCPPDGVSGPGFHHLDLQGRNGAPLADGAYPMFDSERGSIDPRLEHGEHYLLEAGAVVEFKVPLCADVTGALGLRITHNDEGAATAKHEILILRGNEEIPIAEAISVEPGNSGYQPYDRSSLPTEVEALIAGANTSPPGAAPENGWRDFVNAADFALAPRDILARPGDLLLLRTTNLGDHKYGVMVWFPQRGLEYQSFLEIEVPPRAGGQDVTGQPNRPRPGECPVSDPSHSIEVGRSEGGHFRSYPPATSSLEVGPQGSLMLLMAVRGRGFEGGDSSDPAGPSSPTLVIRVALDRAPSDGGRVVADGAWHRAFRPIDDAIELADLRPSVPSNAARLADLSGRTLFVDVALLDVDGLVVCGAATSMAEL